jgi:hypothetical protein
MPDARDLHQIEYRHHQTNDLSPVASSMSSRESLAAWHSRIRAWVRHPHADNLSESACYQAFSNGQAALAWRYWDERAASREDGTRGRPLVSRVLVGSANVLTFDVALAWCRAGPSAQWLGPPPGQVPDGSPLPVVSGEALTAVAREMTPDLDLDSAAQEGLHAVVAAGLDDPSTPLAISVPDTLIQMPLRHCVQCPLLWGLHRITGPLLGSAGRGWSFSTFELALGETDPTSLPAIVFREARDGVKAPPSRWRKEAKVRPFESSALVDGTSYAEMIEFAGWLVAEYRERGGDGLEQFIAEYAGSAGPSAQRIEQVWHALRKSRQPSDASGIRAQTWMRAQESPGGGSAEAGSQEPEPQELATWEPEVRELEVRELEIRELEIREPEVRELEIREPEVRELEIREPEALDAEGSLTEVPQPGAVQDRDDLPGGPASFSPWEPIRPDACGTGSPDNLDLVPSDIHGDNAPMEEGQATIQARSPHVGDEAQVRASQASVSSLLKQLELLGEDQELFQSILDGILQAGNAPPQEREKSWYVISGTGWYESICRNNSFRSGDLASIFALVVIPELASQLWGEAIAGWLTEAPVPMVEGLIAAAQADGQETWDTAMGILEPVLAYRWMIEHYLRDYWHGARAVRPHVDPGRVESKSGFLGIRRKPGGRHRE